MKNYLSQNLSIIEKQFPETGENIRKAKIPPYCRRIADNIILSKGPRTAFMYNQKDIKKHSRELAKSRLFLKENATVIIGTGQGHSLNSIMKKTEKKLKLYHTVIVIEPELFWVKETLSNYDLSEYLEDGRLQIITDSSVISLVLSSIEASKVVQSWDVIIEPYCMFLSDEYEEAVTKTMETINQIRCNTGTVLGAGAKLAQNDVKNIPWLIRNRGINEIKDIYKDKPVIIVSTGPSLEKNIHHLLDNRDRFVIVCVAQALRILLAYGIRPDFACTVDFGETNMGHFEGLMDCGIPLVVLNRTYSELVKKWKGPKFVVSSFNPSPSQEETASSILLDKGTLEQGGSVAHLCLSFAEHIGGNPITMIGQDLSLGKTSHNKQADESGDIFIEDGMIFWKVDDPKSHLKKQDKIFMGQVHWVPGYFGGVVLTNPGLASFISAFQNMILGIKERNPDINIFNSTEGGADIKGAEKKVFKEFIKQYQDVTIDRQKIVSKLTFSDTYIDDIENAVSILGKDIECLEEIIDNSKKGIECLEGVEELSEIEKKKHLKDNEKYSKRAQELSARDPLMSISLYATNRKIYDRDLRVSGKALHKEKNKENLSIRIKRNIIILEEAIAQAEELLSIYAEVKEILEKYIKTNDESILFDYTPEPICNDIKRYQEYIETGRFAQPILEITRYTKDRGSLGDKEIYDIYEKAIEMKDETIIKAQKEDNSEENTKLIKYNYLIEEAHKQGKENQDFSKALELLTEAKKLFPDRFEARWGYATTLNIEGEFEKSIQEFEKLVEDFPENKRLLFELGMVLLVQDMDRGISLIEKSMMESNEFNFYKKNLSFLYKQQGEDKKAIKVLEQYIKDFPADSNGLEELRNLYQEKGYKSKAMQLDKKLNSL